VSAAGAGAFFFGCAGPVLGRDEAAFFADANPFGFILFARNVETPDQIRRLTADLRAAVGRDAPILIDQEGGRVQRLGPPGPPTAPPR
jgi:beta-N-acetylhexosaminidase